MTKLVAAGIILVGLQALCVANVGAPSYMSPMALAPSNDGKTLYVACATANQVLRFDTAQREVSGSISLCMPPTGLTLSGDDSLLYVTCASSESVVCVVDLNSLKTVKTLHAGHTAMAPVRSPDGETLYVCNRFDNDVSVFDLATGKQVRRIAVQREPVAADITKDGRFLLVANHLPQGRADQDYVAAVVSVIDTAEGRVVKELELPNGSHSLNDIRVSPDGRFAALTHIVSSFTRAPVQVPAGWINANALTIIDLKSMKVRYSMLLDQPDKGAANPWGLAWSSDMSELIVAHAGTHELSLIDFPQLLAHLPGEPGTRPDRDATHRSREGLMYVPAEERQLPFIGRSSRRIALGPGDLGSRAVALSGEIAYVANYFSDTVSVVNLNTNPPAVGSALLGTVPKMDLVRQGELNFHDARLCFQGWQSCSSCHPGGGRPDGLNWDLLNDGVSNPKNTKSLLLAHQTPPCMSLGIRANAETAVRAGIKHILFRPPDEDVAKAIDAYLKSLKPLPSPHLVHGELSDSAQRGKLAFEKADCARCHVPGLFTDLRIHDVGTRRVADRPGDKFDTPTLIELWRTAPYLHDGSAATVREVLTTQNADDEHGSVSDLSPAEIDDLCEYLLSL